MIRRRPGRTGSGKFFATLIAFLATSSAGWAREPQADRFFADAWPIEKAVDYSMGLIRQCLSEKSDRYLCISEPFSTCEMERGTSTRALTDCAEIARLTWLRLHDETLSQLADLKNSDSSNSEETISALVESDSSWKQWIQEDCLIRVSSYRDGAPYSFVYSRCMARGFSKRAIDLFDVLEDWRP